MERKQRIIDLVRLAAQAPDPSLHAEQVRSLKTAWQEIGLVGRDTRQLALDYTEAVSRFWTAAKRSAAAREALAEEEAAAGQPLRQAEGRRLRKWKAGLTG